MEETNKNKYLKCKYKVKQWESEFKQVNGKKPSKADIKNAPLHIKEAYKTYWTMKTISLETSLVDLSFGDENTMDGFSLPLDNTETIKSTVDKTANTDRQIEDLPEFTISPNKNGTGNLEDNINVNTSQSINNNCSVQVEKTDGCNENNSVWGSHLSNTHKKEEEKPKQETSATLSRFTAKLFAGATFKKRNPRKSFIRREKSSDYSSLQLEESQSSLQLDFGNSSTQLEPCSTQENKDFEEENVKTLPKEDLHVFDVDSSKLKIVNKCQVQKQSQPISLLQTTFISKTITKPNFESRIFDKGWLERLENRTSIETVGNKVNSSDSGIDLTDSSLVSVEPKSSPASASILQSEKVSDNEDFVCDSDSENERSKSFCTFNDVKNKNSSFKNLSHSLIEKNHTSLCVSSQVKNESEFVKTDKRPIDEIDGEIIISNSKRLKANNSLSNDTSNYYKPEYPQALTKLPRSVQRLTGESKVNSFCNQLVEIQNKSIKTKEMIQEEILRKKVSSGKANENFIKVNLKKKTYVRGKKTMTFQKYKKQKWKEMKKGQMSKETGLYKCFKCGDVGHFAKNCTKACEQLLPVENLDEEDDSLFPTLQEAEEMATEESKKLCVRRHKNDLPIHVSTENSELSDVVPVPPPLCDDVMKLVPSEPICQLNEDGSVCDTPLMVLETLIQFGHDTWRPGQEQAVMRVLSGLSTLVTLSTGSGKSLCYQLPAYLYHTLQNRITIVVSPLVSLMEDQVYGVPACLRVACLHTNQNPKVRENVFEQLRNNSLHALLLSPEALAISDRTGELLRSLPPVAFACIDEAHCISQWSHNFRPSYLMVCQILREKFGVKTILGLTATATVTTITSISETLNLPDGVEGVIRDVPLPDNLQLTVSRDRHKDRALIELLKGQRFSECRSIIVYCTRRDECQRLASYIRTCLQDVRREDGVNKRGKISWNAEAYHAGLTAARRKSVQKAFMSGKTRIVVATVAFGMGINKQDIQGIIHYNMPSAFERYVQEVGRAGRDGQIANCHLFLTTQGEDLCELKRHIYADFVERHTIRKLLQRVFVSCTCGAECSSHEVAFSIDETVSALDLPEENIATLLCYLELHARHWVRVCSPAYTRCRVISYKGTKAIKKAAKECPPLAVAVAMEVQAGTKLEKVTRLEFPIFPVASAIKWDSGIVKRQLKNLEWTKVDDKPRRSGLVVEFDDLGFHVQAPGNLSGEELDSALENLTSKVERQEVTALRQLQAIFNILMEVSHDTVDYCLDEVDDKKNETLKSNIRQYFTEENYLDKHQLIEMSLNNEEQVIADIRNLVNCYRDVSFSGRAVARIFHGISSPNYPAQQWGRCKFWRAHLNEDFKLICKLATRELIKMR